MSKTHLTLSLLHTFVVVAEKKHIGKACGILHVTQPAVSMQLARLADVIGGKLFHDTKSYELTETGSRLLSEAKLIIDMANKIPGMARRPGIRHIHIGFSIDTFDFCQKTVTQEFSSDSLLKIHCMSSGETLAAAMDGTLDLAVVFLPPDYSGPSVGEIPCRLVLSGTNDTQNFQSGRDELVLATYGPTCPYRLTTIKYLQKMNIRFQHTLEASSPAGLNEFITKVGANAPFPLMLRKRRYHDAPFLDRLFVPPVRLGLIAKDSHFIRTNHSRLTRILSNLLNEVMQAEKESKPQPNATCHESA